MISSEELTSNSVYDRYAPHYGFDVNVNMAARLKYDLIEKYLNSNAKVLDVGCANGIHMRLFAKRCSHIDGVDINQPMLDIARLTLTHDKIDNATLRQCSATALDFPNETFDLVYSFATLSLVPQMDKALCEISRVLRVGGIALLDFSGRWNLSHIYWDLYFRRHNHFGQHAVSYGEAVKRLESLGLEVIENHAVGFLDQWRYVPGLHWCKWLDKALHTSLRWDIDYQISNLKVLFPLANRWYFACRKIA
jgi:ubiquinone/menaquinone biosynthesis C-methylase UbiE